MGFSVGFEDIDDTTVSSSRKTSRIKQGVCGAQTVTMGMLPIPCPHRLRGRPAIRGLGAPGLSSVKGGFAFLVADSGLDGGGLKVRPYTLECTACGFLRGIDQRGP
jgi:hypothetical protein